MKEKLLITSKLLVKFLKIFSGLFHPVVPKSVLGKAYFLMFFLLFAFTANAQLATETFESGIPATWAQANNGVGTTPFTISTDGYNSSTGAAFINPTAENIGAGNTAQYYLVTPLISVSNGDQIRFFTKQGDVTDHGNVYQIRVSTASPTDISSFTTLATFTEADLSTTYTEKVVPFVGLAGVVNVYVAFVLVNDQPGAAPDADTWFIDNVKVQTPQVCNPVLAANFTVTSVGSQSAELSWTHPTTSDFQIQIVADGAPPGTTGFDTDNTYSASGLTADTDYDVYIKAICSESESIWAGPFNFSTNILGVTCAEPIVIPDDGNTYVYAGNLNVFQNPAVTYTTQGSNCLPSTVTQNYLNGAKAFFSYTPTTSGLITLTHLITTPSSNDYGSLLVYNGCSNVGVECIAGTFNTSEGVTKVIPNLYVEAGNTYIIVASSQLSATASISFKITVSTSDCPPPAAFTYSHLLQNTVSFSWDNTNNLMSNWQYAAVPAGSPAPATGTDTTTNVDNTVTGLAAGTTYDFYVRSVCGGIPGPWSLPYKFKTQCDVYTLPYSTQFTGTSATVAEPCWTPLDINGDNLTWTYLGSYATIQTNTYPDLNNDMLVSPQFNFTGGMKRIRFKDRSTNGVSSYSIKISTTGIGASDFTTTVMPETQITNTGFVERFVYLPVITGNVNIAFVVTPGTGSVATRISIDDVYVEDAPACPDPLNLSVGTLTTSSAELSWDAGLNETEWRVVVQPVGTGVPTVEGEVATTNVNFLVDELDHSTQYEYYVRAYCNSTDQSNWVGPFNFITECGSFDVPFFEDFDNDLDTHRYCWTPLNLNGDQFVFQNFSASVTDIRIQRGNFGAPPASFDDWIISPAINVTGTKELKFDYKAMVGPFFPTPRLGVEVLMSTTDTDPASFTVIMPLMEVTNTSYIEKALYINANGPVYIAFRVPPSFDTSLGVSGLQIDNVRIDEAPACPNPSAITVANITTSSADVAWTAGFIEPQWQVVVQPAGTGIPSTGTTVDDAEYSVATGTLTSDTYYEVYVRAYCNDTDQSEWIGPYTFKTLCDAYPTPFLETFNPTSATEQCWIIRNDNGDVSTFILNGTTNPYEGSESAGMFTGNNGDNDDWLISPTITVTAGQRLRYYYRVNDSFFEEDLEVLLSTTGIEPADFTEVLYSTDTDTNPLNNTQWKEKVINLTGYTGNINIAWHIPQETPNPAGYRGQQFILDNVIIEDIPTCSQPTNLTVQNIADTQVQLKWDATGTETAWDIYVQPAGLGAPVGDGNPAYFTAGVTTNPYTKTGLIAATEYEYYVRAACGAGDSEWVGPFTFITLCPLDTACEYTFTITNPTAGGLSGEVQVIQNGLVVGTIDLVSSAAGATNSYTVFLCDGVEFSLLWDGIGYVPGSSANAVVTIQQGTNTIWTSPTPFGPMNDVVYEGFASCSPVTCAQPTNLTVNQNGTLSWTAGGTETQWEVFIQPVGNGTLPQSGTIVNATPSYSPVSADFNSLTDGTYEFFVRAVCGEGDESFWSGPQEFVRNDSSANSIELPVNTGEICEVSGAKASFYGATVSPEPMTCAGANNGDIWYEFEATSTAHIIELNDFSGDYYSSTGNPPHPSVTMTLYHVNGTVLEEMSCATNNAIVAAYSTATVIGDTYKVRLSLNGGSSNKYTFSVCVKTPNNLCAIDSVNGSFETPDAVFGFLFNFFRQEVIPGWRYNFPGADDNLFIDSYNALGIVAYDGGQVIQVLTPETAYDPADMVNVFGLQQDFDSSEITQYNYAYAVATRFDGNVMQVFAGPPSGPFVLIEENQASAGWQYIEGTYDVPAGQDETRFIFRPKDNGIGLILDAISITANNEIITQQQELDCTEDSIELEARGTGMWSADENNPTEVVFTDAANSTTTVSGLIASGDYTFYWNTRYCENTIVISNVAVDDVPEVVTPVEYCEGATADPLTAPALADHTLVWYTDPVGGTALAGAPTPSTTTVGTTSYYVAYANTDGCEGQRAQIDVTINEVFVPVVGFTYDAETYCMAEANPVITLDADFTTGGTFTATPAGLTIDAATGEIDMTTSTAGTYDITYTVEAVDCNPEGTNTVTITLNPLVTPVTGFTYAEAYCIAETTNPVPTTEVGFYAGGEFTAEAGLAIDTATGEIDLANTTAGTYEVTYTVAEGDCLEGGSTTFTVTITDLSVAVVEFSYDSPSCLNSGAELVPSIAEGFTFGGTFSSTTLTVDAETGIVDLTTATAGSHDIVYTVDVDPLTCTDGGTYTATIELTEGITPVVEFSYDNSTYCYDSENPIPTTAAGFFTGGTFTSDDGLAIDAATGEIDILASTAGTYDVTYTVAMDEETCNVGGTYTTTVTITGDLSVAVTQDCRGENVWLTASAVNGTFDSNVSYVWRNESGVAVSNSSEFNVAEYYAANSSLELPLVFTVTVTSGSCTGEAAYTVETIMCQIPRGISPNGDGDNDTFDLTDLGVNEIVIFNRYGKKVFHQSNGYTNQWHGQDEKNNELPDGTYFYSLTKSNGESITGWVYISREY